MVLLICGGALLFDVDGETLGTILLMLVGHDTGTYFGLE